MSVYHYPCAPMRSALKGTPCQKKWKHEGGNALHLMREKDSICQDTVLCGGE